MAVNDRGRIENARRTGPALEAMYLLWLVPTVEKFPRTQKFLLGDRLQLTALDVLERLIEPTPACGNQHSARQTSESRS